MLGIAGVFKGTSCAMFVKSVATAMRISKEFVPTLSPTH